ncbi:MAG TPA: uracil-DNA glycosylase [Chloroflexota bacterium]|jgi:uracil-DNA glycosylase family 4
MNDSATLPGVHVCQPWGPNTPDRAFAQLVDAVHECRRCPRMEGRRRVLGQANGPLSARLLFVAEAPGRLGAEVSGVPLTGDRAGRTFAALLEAGGFERSAIFVTNAVLCNPRDAAGRNDRPTCREVANCGPHLVRLLQILRPDWVVTLGAVALHAVGRVMPHGLVLGRDVGRPIAWQGRWLVPLYHPGPRALIHRPLAVQQVDYACLAALVAS